MMKSEKSIPKIMVGTNAAGIWQQQAFMIREENQYPENYGKH